MEMGLRGCRILIVEDEALIALDLEYSLRRAGCSVVGPAASVTEALGRLDEPMDAALLDVNLDGQQIFPVADALAARDIPFVFLTGYADEILPERFRQRPICRKPCAPSRPVQALLAILGRI